MRYDDPELRERLAGDYILGTMPIRVRRRFERLMSADPALARLVGDWADRLAPLDRATPAETPPAHVWRAIERRIVAAVPIAPATPPLATPPWFRSLGLWRGWAVAASAMAVGLLIYVAVLPGRAPTPTVVAVLTGHRGEPGWLATAGPKAGEISVSAVEPPPESKSHAFQLWGIAGGPPRSLGLLPTHPGNAVTLPAERLPPPGALLAVSLESPGGSPTGLPTGPVLYQGKVLPGGS